MLVCLSVRLSVSMSVIASKREVSTQIGIADSVAPRLPAVVVLLLLRFKAGFNLQFQYPKRHKAVLGVPVQGTVM